MQSFGERLRTCLRLLSPIESTQAFYKEVGEADRKKRAELAAVMQRAFKELKAIERDLAEHLSFADIITLRTIRSWSRLDASDVEVFFELTDDETALLIGLG